MYMPINQCLLDVAAQMLWNEIRDMWRQRILHCYSLGNIRNFASERKL